MNKKASQYIYSFFSQKSMMNITTNKQNWKSTTHANFLFMYIILAIINKIYILLIFFIYAKKKIFSYSSLHFVFFFSINNIYAHA